MRPALFSVQLLYALGWTIYVIYLPSLLDKAGIAKAWLLPILIADQLLFAVADIACGFALDKVERLMALFARWIVGGIIVSAALFAALPAFAGHVPPSAFLIILLAWVALSSLARVPPLVLLAKYTTREAMTPALTVWLFGIGVAAAIAPFLTVMLKNVSPWLPFLLASVTLAIATLTLARAFRNLPAPPAAMPIQQDGHAPTRGTVFATLLATALVAALAVQIHTAMNSAALFRKGGGGASLEWLMPVFWVGFTLILFPVSLALSRQSLRHLLAPMACGAGVTALLVAALAPPLLTVLIPAQLVAGVAWGITFSLLLDGAQRLGRAGREGAWIGLTVSALALAAATRIGLTLAAVPGAAPATLWAPVILWGLATVGLFAVMRR
jgi:hypothetical protein